MPRLKLICVLLLFGVLLSSKLLAQWTDQTILLRPGWNAVHLDVQPEPAECDRLFGGRLIESVWAWNRRAGGIQFIQDPGTLIPAQQDWLTWLPQNHPLAREINLFSLEGGRCYLIKLADNSSPVILNLRGIPSLRKIEWIPDALNFVGFSAPAPSSASLLELLGGSVAHSAGPVYRLSAVGHWEIVADLGSTTIQPGEAFWVRTRGASHFQGPLSVTLLRQDGLHFGRTLVEQTLRVRNDSLRSLNVRLKRLTSFQPPPSSQTGMAGEVPLYYWQFDPSKNKAGWTPLPAELTHASLAPGQEWLLRLEVRRTEMAKFLPSPGLTQALYQSLLEVSDDHGLSRVLIPATAEDPASSSAGVGRASLGSKAGIASSTPKNAGLWIGKAIIDKVNRPAAVSEPDKPLNTASEIQFRLIVHVDDSGHASLLQKVMLMWKDGTTEPDPRDPTKRVLSEPGRYVLVTDDSKLPLFSGAALRDGVAVGRRFSSAAFGFSGPIRLGGSGDFGEGTSTGLVKLGYDDPLNPFKHKYHPDHDNLDEVFKQKLPAGRESFDVNRRITLEFMSSDPHNLQLAGWGDTQIGGVYREAISGLHKNTLFLEGTFRLQRASRVTLLNDGL